MRQLTFVAPSIFEWWDLTRPRIEAETDALVRPLAVARCDLDLYIANGFVKYPGPFAFGHETIAEVVEAGSAVSFQPGDRVAVPFQLSCGRCATCRKGLTNSCESYPFGAAFGLKPTSGTEFGGALSDVMRVPFADHMLVGFPAHLDPVAAASASDNIADGWRAVAPFLKDMPGATVLVVGGLAKSVGLYAAGAAVALGAGRVLYLDDNGERTRRATLLGAETAPLNLAHRGRAEQQFDIVVEAAGDEAALGFCIQSVAPNGVLTSVAIHFGATTAVPLTRAYYKGLTWHTGRVQARRYLPEVLACMTCGALRPDCVTHRIVPFCDAGDAMADPGPKIIFSNMPLV